MEFSAYEGRRLRQFIILFRHFRDRLKRDFFGVGEGDASNGVTTTLALLVAYSLCLSVFLVIAYGFQLIGAKPAEKIEALISARDVLTASTIALTGSYFVFLWENLFPDRNDCHVLLAQPVSRLTVLAAKLSAALAFLGTFLVALHCCTSVVIPFLAITSGAPRLILQFPIYWLAQALTAVLIFFILAAVLAIAMAALPYRLFVLSKPALQFATFTLVLGQLFFSPPIKSLMTPAADPLPDFPLLWPAFWFTALADVLADGFVPHGPDLAFIALIATVTVPLIGLAAILLAYPRAIRYAMEETEFAQRRSARFSIAEIWLAPWLSDDSKAYALGLYTLRILLRDARSRALFLLYAGLAAGYGLRGIAQQMNSSAPIVVSEPNVYLLPIPLILVFFMLVAIRSLCATPISLPSAWIFRLVDCGNRRRIRRALRGVLLAVVVFPVAICCLVFHVWSWDSWLACTHTVFVLAFSLVMMEWALQRLDFVPFTQPKPEQLGRLRVMFGIYAVFFMTLTFFVAHIEFALLSRPFAFVVTILAAVMCWLTLLYRNERNSQFLSLASPEPPSLIVGLRLDG